MTKPTAIQKDTIVFRDTTGSNVKTDVRNIPQKEADGNKRIGAHMSPASKESLSKLAEKFAKQ